MSVTTIRSVLLSGYTQRIHFELPGIPVAIAAGEFVEIAQLLVEPASRREGQIAVEVNPDLGHHAMYRHQSNTLLVPRPDFPTTLPEEALLIHEAVHIHNDKNGVPLPWDEDEMLAYVAQMLYLQVADPITYGGLAAVRDAQLQRAGIDVDAEAVRDMMGVETNISGARDLAVERHAADVASAIYSSRTPTGEQLFELRAAIRQHPAYVDLPVDYETGEASHRHYGGL